MPFDVVAHLLTGSPVPLALQWLAAMLFFGGALTVLVVQRSRVWRSVALAACTVGAAATFASCVASAFQPGPSPYSLRIASPPSGSRVASPVLLTVCGLRGDGSSLPATDASHYLVVFVDGHEVPTVDDWQFGETMAPGKHTIRVELVTPAHHVFNPPAIASTTVTVEADAQMARLASC